MKSDNAGLAAAPTRTATADRRDDIEGLRAVAILLVLLFHFEMPGMSGGFSGVDVFFVISGYLMTRQLMARPLDLTAVGHFYRKRCWRIVPACYVAIAGTLAIASAFFIPVDLIALGRSVTPALLFYSNHHFAGAANYFGAAAIHAPLLHTWSLAVEVQFYLIWPLFIWLARRFGRTGSLTVLLATVAASFALSLGLSIADPTKAFYLMPTRLWQFGAGALVAWLPQAPMRVADRRDTIIGIISLGAIVVTGVLASRETLWPGIAALVPTVATAWLILAGGRFTGPEHRLLSAPSMRFVGSISYSLYLVHWPVVVLLAYLVPEGASLPLRLAAMLVCIPLAVLLLRGVEAPLRLIGRTGGLAPDRPSMALLASLVLLSAAGMLAARTGGFPGRWSHEVLATDALIREPPVSARNCPRRALFAGEQRCVLGDPAAAPSAVLWGDSHAQHFAAGFDAWGRANGRAFLLAIADACPPVIGIAIATTRWRTPTGCGAFSEAVAKAIEADTSIRTLYLAGRWAYYAEAARYGSEPGRTHYIIDPARPVLERPQARAVLERQLRATIARVGASGRRVVLIDQVAEIGIDAGRCVAHRQVLGRSFEACDLARAEVEARQAFSAPMLRRLAEAGNSALFDPKSALCDDRVCHVSGGGRPWYRDDDHLNALGSTHVGARLLTAHPPP